MIAMLLLVGHLIAGTITIEPFGERFIVQFEPGAIHACTVFVRAPVKVDGFTDLEYTYRSCRALSTAQVGYFVDWTNVGCNTRTKTCDNSGDWTIYARVGYPDGEEPDLPGWTQVEYQESNRIKVTRE